MYLSKNIRLNYTTKAGNAASLHTLDRLLSLPAGPLYALPARAPRKNQTPLCLKPARSLPSALEKPGTSADKTAMTTACPRALYAPNPPQLDEPWLKIALLLVAVVLIAAVIVGS